jgi:PhzF family phenazine biosynthesis protein
MSVPVFRVDAFAERPFAGNPAAVCLLDTPRKGPDLQRIARELSLPATAFVHAQGAGFDLRWFSPTLELTLCGHGTLAAAHVLWEVGALAADAPARFATLAGPLVARRGEDGVELDFPAEPASEAAAPPALAEALGVTPRWTGRNRLDYLLEVDAEATVRALAPDLARLAAVDARGVIVTARAEAGAFDFVSRFFAPRAGIPEDFVTGSAHCCLGPYWAERLGRSALTGYQASARGGVVRVRVGAGRVRLAGRAVTVLRGSLR